MEVMARPDEHPKLKVLRCKRMYICWDNAQADCLSGTVNVYKKCEF
jgi:hypothetical protein